jgi:hypothetical protein
MRPTARAGRAAHLPRHGLRAFIPALVLAAVVGAGSPVAAVGPFHSHSGKVGVHVLIDNAEYGGMVCTYGTEGSDPPLAAIRVRRPIAFAVDRTKRVDSQLLRWRFRILGGDGGGTWTRVHQSRHQTARATDWYPAPFQPRSYRFAGDASLAHDYYRVIVTIEWLAPTGKVTGRAAHEVFYRQHGQDIRPGKCTSVVSG